MRRSSRSWWRRRATPSDARWSWCRCGRISTAGWRPTPLRGAAEWQPRAGRGRWIARSWRGRSSSRPLAPGWRSSVGWLTRWCPTWPGEPGGLPLLSTTLLELWRARDGRALRYDSYRTSGGVRGAVARLAEAAYTQLGETERRIARGVMLRLASGEDGGAHPPPRAARRARATRRRRTRARGADRRSPVDRQRRRGRALPRGAAARVAALPDLARGGPCRAAPARTPDQQRARMGHNRSRSGRPLPWRAAHRRARVGRATQR